MTAEAVQETVLSTTRVRVLPEHIRQGKAASLTRSAAALAITEAIGTGTVTVSVDTDITTAHEQQPPFRWWHAETPPEGDEWLNLLDGGGHEAEVADAARLGRLDFEIRWHEGTTEAATAAGTEH